MQSRSRSVALVIIRWKLFITFITYITGLTCLSSALIHTGQYICHLPHILWFIHIWHCAAIFVALNVPHPHCPHQAAMSSYSYSSKCPASSNIFRPTSWGWFLPQTACRPRCAPIAKRDSEGPALPGSRTVRSCDAAAVAVRSWVCRGHNTVARVPYRCPFIYSSPASDLILQSQASQMSDAWLLTNLTSLAILASWELAAPFSSSHGKLPLV